MSIKLIILDCDKTLWSHEDISSMKPPFELVDKDVLIDSVGEELRLNEGVRDFLNYVKNRGILLAVASWNIREFVIEALEKLELDKYFDYIVVEFHPNKELMVDKILKYFNSLGVGVHEGEVLFVDDNIDMIRKVKKLFPQMIIIHYGVDVKNFYELIRFLEGLL